MMDKKDLFYCKETIASIIENPKAKWNNQFKETIISMIASNKNDMLWYANFLTRCEYEFHFDESFVSCVYYNGNNFVIAINPIILELLNKNEIIAILKHSAGHIIHHHFSRIYKNENIDKEIVEIAKDIVINGSRGVPYIKDIPGSDGLDEIGLRALFYEILTEKYAIQNFEIGREFEYYVNLILESKKQNHEDSNASCSDTLDIDYLDAFNNADDEGDNGVLQADNNEEYLDSGNPNDNKVELNDSMNDLDSLAKRTLTSFENGDCKIDSHSYGEQLQDSIGIDGSVLEKFMDSTLNEMIEDSTNFARGFTPSDANQAQQRIKKRKAHKDWRKIFNKKMRNFLSNSLRYREVNKSRQHPIYPDDIDLYGYNPSKKPNLGIVLDVSGSVDDELLIMLMSEIQAIMKKYGIKNITLVQVDAKIQSIKKFGVRDKLIIRHGETTAQPQRSILS